MEESKEGRYYVVKKGDSLWGIAKHFGFNVEQIATFNDLTGKQKHLIQVGQKIYLPDGKAGPDLKLSVKVVGLSNKPVKNAKLKLKHDGKETELKTDGSGWLHGLDIQDHLKGLQIEFENYERKWQKILDEEILPLGEKILQINILTDLLKGRTFRKDGPTIVPDRRTSSEIKKETPQPKTATTKDLNNVPAQPIVKETRTDDGVPTTINAPLFASENLYLQKGNEKFRQALIESAKRYGFTPHSLAAIINAEAGKTKDATWVENSAAGGSSARGLGQFLPLAWLEYVAKDGTLGNKDALKLLGATTLIVAKEKLYKVSVKGKVEVSGPIKEKILNWRDDGIYSIDAIASYSEDNLLRLKKFEIDTAELSPDEKAKIAYVMHHEGPGDGTLYLQGKLGRTLKSPPEKIADKLAKQFKSKYDDGKEKAQKLAARFGGDYVKAYYYFLANHTNANVNVKNFMLNQNGFTERSAFDVIKSVAQLEIEKPAVREDTPTKSGINRKTTGSVQENPEVGPHEGVGGTESWFDPLDRCIIRVGGYSDSETDPIKARSKSLFGGRSGKHKGIDLCAIPGTSVKAVADGYAAVVGEAGTYGIVILLKVEVHDLPSRQKEYAKVAVGRQPSGAVYFLYAHLNETIVSEGDFVKAGEIIGKTGNTGNAKKMTEVGKKSPEKYGAHLHFEVRRSRSLKKGEGQWFDPKPFFIQCD